MSLSPLDPPNHRDDHAPISRRGVCRALMFSAGIGALPGLLALAGCGGGGGGDTSSTPAVKLLANLAEIGGTGLRSVSAWSQEQAIGAGGEATTPSASDQPYILFVADAVGAIRALAVVPSGSQSADSSLPIDAESTVLSLLWLTPGFRSGATNPQERLNALRPISEFVQTVAHFRANLIAKSVPDLIAMPETNNLLTALLEKVVATRAVSRGIQPDNVAYGVSGKVVSSSDPNNVRLKLNQSAWRTLGIWRQDIDANDRSIGALIANPDYLKGLDPVSFSNVFFTPAESSTEWVDPFTADFSANFTARYYLVGPGFLSGDARPAGISSVSVAKIYLLNLAGYVMVPILETLGVMRVQAPGALAEPVKKLVEFLLNADTVSDLIEKTSAAWNSGNAAAVNEALQELVLVSIKFLLDYVKNQKADLVFAGQVIVSFAKVSTLGFILGAITLILSGANLYIAIREWSSKPSLLKFEFRGTGDGQIIVT